MSNFELAIANVLELEGGFVDNKHDPGGVTDFGISLRFLKTLPGMEGDVDRDGDVDADDIKAMTKVKAKSYYKKNWWDKYDYKNIDNPGVVIKVLDMSVNMGGLQAHKLIQRACRSVGTVLVDDGILGEKSFAAINTAQSQFLIPALRCTQAGFYYALVMRNAALRKAGVKKKGKEYEDFSVFLEGWLNRAYK
jgi:lysozyme family protein